MAGWRWWSAVSAAASGWLRTRSGHSSTPPARRAGCPPPSMSRVLETWRRWSRARCDGVCVGVPSWRKRPTQAAARAMRCPGPGRRRRRRRRLCDVCPRTRETRAFAALCVLGGVQKNDDRCSRVLHSAAAGGAVPGEKNLACRARAPTDKAPVCPPPTPTTSQSIQFRTKPIWLFLPAGRVPLSTNARIAYSITYFKTRVGKPSYCRNTKQRPRHIKQQNTHLAKQTNKHCPSH